MVQGQGMRVVKMAASFVAVVTIVALFAGTRMHQQSRNETGDWWERARRLSTPEFLKQPKNYKKFESEVKPFRKEFKNDKNESFTDILCTAYDGMDHANKRACCANSCGDKCGAVDCQNGNGGSKNCCNDHFEHYCSKTQQAPCWLNVTKLAEVFADKSCIRFNGIDHPSADACCHPQCGEFCGGSQCHLHPTLEKEHCCKQAMTKKCSAEQDAPCLLTKKEEEAPFDLTYPGASTVFSCGDDISLKPEAKGHSPTKWSITPDLPEGLELNRQTGEIQGKAKPSFLITRGHNRYTVTAEDDEGWTTFQWVLAVKPCSLAYPSHKEGDFSPGQKVNIVPTASALPLDGCTIHPDLPDGLTLNKETCVIEGVIDKDQETIDQTFTITAKNEAGESTSEFVFKTGGTKPEVPKPEVPKPEVPKPKKVLTKPGKVRYHGGHCSGNTCSIPFGSKVDVKPKVIGGSSSIVSCTVSPELPKGLKVDKHCRLHGVLDTDAQTGEKKYSVTATNPIGSETTEFTIVSQCTASDTFTAGGEVSFLHKLTGASSRSYTIKPALPKGLKLDRTSGEIHGSLQKKQKLGDYKFAVTEESSTGTRICNLKMTVEAPFPMWIVIAALLLLLLVCCLGLLWRNMGDAFKYTQLKDKKPTPREEAQPLTGTTATPAAASGPPPAAAAPAAAPAAAVGAAAAAPASEPAEAPVARKAERKKSNWREDAPAPEEEAPQGTAPKSVQRAKTFSDISLYPTLFQTEQKVAAPSGPQIPLTWKTPTGEEKTVIARKRPLGLTFVGNKLPIKITDEKAGSHAAEIGIKVGWTLTKIGDHDIAECETFYEVDTMLHTAIGGLPA